MSKSTEFKKSGYMIFLDIMDYNFDGKDEFIFVEHGYEHQDVMIYELKDNKFHEIYRIATSPT